MTHQTLSLEKYWKLLPATLTPTKNLQYCDKNRLVCGGLKMFRRMLSWPHKFKVSRPICFKRSQIWPFKQHQTFNLTPTCSRKKEKKTSGSALKALESGNIPKAKEELNKGISLINSRQKIIKLADKSEFGWATVQEYVSDELADDEGDASKIKKAEKRAAVKIKTLQEKKRKTSSKVSSTPAPPSFSASRPGSSFGSFPSASSYFRPQSRYSYNSFRASDLCFRCGKRGHWATFCNFRDKPLSSGSKPWLFGTMRIFSAMSKDRARALFKGNYVQTFLFGKIPFRLRTLF